MAQASACRKRPFGVLALIVLQAVTAGVALLGVVGTAVAWRNGELGPLLAGLDLPPSLSQFVIVAGLAAVVVLNVVTVVGLWRLQRWAWTLMILLVGLSMLVNLWGYFFGEPQFFDMTLDVLIVFYLNLRETRAIFRSPGRDSLV